MPTPDVQPIETSFAPNPDITFRSRDGILFYIHKIHLHVEAGGFPPAEFRSSGEIIDLTEDSATLGVLFKFLYPVRRAGLGSIDYHLLEAVAEAAEKYEVYRALDTCYVRLEEALPAQANRVLLFAYNHAKSDLLDKAALALLGHPFEEVMKKLPTDLTFHWALYYNKWNRVQREACSWHIDMDRSGCARAECLDIVRDMGGDVLVITSPDLQARLSKVHQTDNWVEYVKKRSEGIPKFSSLVNKTET